MNKKRTVFLYYLGLIILVIAFVPYSQSLSANAADTQTLNQASQYQNSLSDNSGSSLTAASQDQLNQANQTVIQDEGVMIQDQTHALIAGLFMLMGGVIALVVWIRTLMGLSRLQEWNWFFGILAAGVVVMYIYLKSGPQIPKNITAIASATAPQRPPQVAASAQPPLNALEILQQRYARGEIDTATYQSMAQHLQSTNTP